MAAQGGVAVAQALAPLLQLGLQLAGLGGALGLQLRDVGLQRLLLLARRRLGRAAGLEGLQRR